MNRALRIALCALPAVVGGLISVAWLVSSPPRATGGPLPAFRPEAIDLGLGRPGEMRAFEATLVNAGGAADVLTLESPSCNLSRLEPTLVHLAAGETCIVRGQVRVLGPGDCSAQVLVRGQVGGSITELPIAIGGHDEPYLPVTAIPLGIAPGGGRSFDVRVPVYVGEGAWAGAPVRGRVEGDLEGVLEWVHEHVPAGYVVVAGSARALRDDLHGVLDGRIAVRIDGSVPLDLEGRLLCEVTPPAAAPGWSTCRVMLREREVVLDLPGASILAVARERPEAEAASWVDLVPPQSAGSTLHFRRRAADLGGDPRTPEDFLVTTDLGVVRVRVLDALREPSSGT